MDKTDNEKSTKFYCKCVCVLFLGPHVYWPASTHVANTVIHLFSFYRCEMFCDVLPIAIYDDFVSGAIRMTAGGCAPPPIHFIDSKWICDSSSNGFLIMALGFLPTIKEGMGAESDER